MGVKWALDLVRKWALSAVFKNDSSHHQMEVLSLLDSADRCESCELTWPDLDNYWPSGVFYGDTTL